MNRTSVPNRNPALAILWLPVALLALTVMLLWISSTKVYALPEYSKRSGEPCAACHVNPGGGGPRTLRGLLWSARGKPDQIPEVPGMLIAPRVKNGAELYQDACAGCHGVKGEGRSAYGLVNLHIRKTSIRSFILNGVPRLGMPGYAGRFTDEQIEILTDYVTGLGNGTVEPQPDRYPLQPGLFLCSSAPDHPACATTYPENGGN